MRALVVDAELLSRLRIVEALEDVGFAVIEQAQSSGEALVSTFKDEPDVVIISADLETTHSGTRLADKLRAEHGIECIVTSDPTTRSTDNVRSKSDLASLAGVARTHAKRRRSARHSARA